MYLFVKKIDEIFWKVKKKYSINLKSKFYNLLESVLIYYLVLSSFLYIINFYIFEKKAKLLHLAFYFLFHSCPKRKNITKATQSLYISQPILSR